MSEAENTRKVRKGFIYGTLVLSLSGFLSKICGAVFKIPLTNLVGAEAMGYFGSAYSIYNFLLSLATAGIPTGISTMVARFVAKAEYSNIKRLLKISATIFVSFAALLTAFGLIFAHPLAEFMNSDKAYWCVMAIMPAVFFISIVAVFRGFFQGYNNMVPTACSNVIEALFKLCAGYGIAYYLSVQGYEPEVVVGGAMLGVTLGTAVSCVFMLLTYVFRNKNYRFTTEEFSAKEPSRINSMAKRFLGISLPIMLSSITANLMSALDAFFVVNRLEGYLDESAANLRWGCYSSLALTVFNLPSFLIISIGTSLVPSIAAGYARKNYDEINSTIDSALKFCGILSFGCAFGLSAVSSAAINLFFGSQGAETKMIASQLLSLISFALVCVGFTNVTASILQAVGKAHYSVISVVVGTSLKTLITYLLTGLPNVNIMGAPIATNLVYPIMFLINLYFIRRFFHYHVPILNTIIKPLICGIACFASVTLFRLVMPDSIVNARWIIFPEILVGVVVFFVLALMIRLVEMDKIRTFLQQKLRRS